MNIVQLIEKIRTLIDHVNSPRYDETTICEFIDTAIDKICLDRYQNIKKEKRYSFEAIQRIKDELYTLVKSSPTITATGNILPIASYPVDYRFMLDLNVIIDTIEYNSESTTYDLLKENSRNPHRRPTLVYPDRVYHLESNTGLTLNFGDSGTLASGIYNYLKMPLKVKYGVERVGVYVFTVDTAVICASLVCVLNAVTYYLGDEIAALNTETLTSGTVVEQFVNTDIPQTLHEEIAKTTVELMTLSNENYNKNKFMEKENDKV